MAGRSAAIPLEMCHRGGRESLAQLATLVEPVSPGLTRHTMCIAIPPQHVALADALAQRFAHAQPSRHAVIDGLLDAELAERLLAEFPPFERGRARG